MSNSSDEKLFADVEKFLREKVDIVCTSSDKKQKVYLFGESEENILRGRDYKSLAYLAYCIEEVILKISENDSIIQDMVCERGRDIIVSEIVQNLIEELTNGESYCIREYELQK